MEQANNMKKRTATIETHRLKANRLKFELQEQGHQLKSEWEGRNQAQIRLITLLEMCFATFLHAFLLRDSSLACPSFLRVLSLCASFC